MNRNVRYLLRSFGLGLFALVATAFVPAVAAPLVNGSELVGSDVIPVARDFTIAQAGNYQLQLTDLGFPANLASLKASVTRGNKLVASIAAPGTVDFSAPAAGTYRLLVAGLPIVQGGVGTFGAKVVPAGGGTAVLDYSDSIQGVGVSSNNGQATVQTQFTVGASGSHRVTLADAAFPTALESINVLVTRGGVEYARLDASNPTKDFSAATTGTYDLLIVAKAAAPALAGLYSIRVTNLDSGSALYDESLPVGRVSGPTAVALPSDGSYALALADLNFPVALGSVGAALTRGSTVLAARTTTGTSPFNATAGASDLFTVHEPADSTASGSGTVELSTGATRVYSEVLIASPSLESGAAALFKGEFTAASGGYRATLVDFQFPGAFAALQLAVVQNGQLLGTHPSAGTLDFTAAAGKVTALVVAQPASGVGSGLAGLQVTAQPAGTMAFETTQAVGALFQSRTIDISTAGSYDVSLTDLGFPAPFTELSIAVTRGTTRVGSIFGGGTFSFNATPGEYSLNLISRVNSTAKFGSYGLLVDTTPPQPVVTLGASPSSVKSGGQTKLTWSTTTATSCVASDGWTGSKATSGSQSVGPITAETKYTLACTGPGGATTASVTVTLQKPSSSGGGGPIDLAFVLLGLAGASGALRRKRVAA